MDEQATPQEVFAGQTSASRQRENYISTTLRERARKLHAEAVRIDALADQVERLGEEAQRGLFDLMMRNRDGF